MNTNPDIARGLEALNAHVALMQQITGASLAWSDHIRTVREALTAAQARIDELERENEALAAWQCVYHDGKTGIVCDEGGGQYCAMERRATKAETQLAEAVNALGDLSFECFAVFDTRKPSMTTYNRTFTVLDELRRGLKK